MTVAELEKAIRYHQEKYYSGISEITDAEFDEMWDELKKLDPENAIFSDVFDFSKDFPKESHAITAGSQNKVNDLDSLKKWLKNIKGEKVSISYKLDGHSIVLYYTNGKLDKALTRGDGKTGSNVTKNVVKMHNVKTQLNSDFTGALRGEILCLKPEKDKYFPEMKNCRNAVSVMHRIDRVVVVAKNYGECLGKLNLILCKKQSHIFPSKEVFVLYRLSHLIKNNLKEQPPFYFNTKGGLLQVFEKLLKKDALAISLCPL